MKRVHVLEFEDLPWFPSWLRTSMTNVLVVLARLIGVTPVLSQLVSRALGELKLDRIVDLGSGAGGSMPDVLEAVRQQATSRTTSLVLTDLHPNDDAVALFNDEQRPHVTYQRGPVNATDIASAPAGLKTMINCFHHMRPETARAILRSAHDNREPLLVYEMGDNKVPLWLWCLALPISLPIVALSCLLLTPLVRPLTMRQLVFTYLLPIIPLLYAWDGQASMPRLYTLSDMDELLQGLDSPEYRWEKATAKTATGRNLGTYLLGMPVAPG